MPFDWPELHFRYPLGLWAVLALIPVFWWFAHSLIRLPRWQRTALLFVRCAVVLLLVLALAGLTARTVVRRAFVIFAVDDSLSVDEDAREQVREFIAEATADAADDDWSVLSFAEGVRVDEVTAQAIREVRGTAEAADWRNAPSGDPATTAGGGRPDSLPSATGDRDWRSSTNPAAAILAASASFPPDRIPRLVLLTDGNETTGDALAAAANAAVTIHAVPLSVRNEPDLELRTIRVPHQIAVNEPFPVEVVVAATQADDVLLELWRGDVRTQVLGGTVAAGENSFFFTERIDRPTRFSARVRRLPPSGTATAGEDASGAADVSRVSASDAPPDGPPEDSFRDAVPENNRGAALVFTSPPPRVLLIQREPELGRSLEWALAEESIVVETRPPRGMPQTPEDLAAFDVLMLSDTPASALTDAQMELVRSWVADGDGGFVMLGGDQSFGPGGYAETPIDRLLPVRCDPERDQERPGLAMVLVIDKSGSMGGQKIALAKEAARGTVNLLGPQDQIGVIAFDGAPDWVSEIRPVTDREQVVRQIASIRPDGGTSLYPALVRAFEALRQTPARLKHVIVLTDGYSTPGDFETIVSRMSAARITVSAVGVGDTDRLLLERIARLGRGRYYFTDDPGSIPQIFARETLAAGSTAIREEPFLPQQLLPSPILADVDVQDAPFLLGYVVTPPEPTAEVVLATEIGHPLLATWRYGLGITAAFTSDASRRWAAEWLGWEGYSRFWAQVVRFCSASRAESGLVTQITRRGTQTTISVDVTDDRGRLIPDAELELTVVDPQQQQRELMIPQTGPGRCETTITTAEPGTWMLQVREPGSPGRQVSRSLVISFPDEFRQQPVNAELLQQITGLTGGVMRPDPESLFRPAQDPSVRMPQPLWSWLLTAALLLFVVDVALRRLRLPERSGSDPL